MNREECPRCYNREEKHKMAGADRLICRWCGGITYIPVYSDEEAEYLLAKQQEFRKEQKTESTK